MMARTTVLMSLLLLLLIEPASSSSSSAPVAMTKTPDAGGVLPARLAALRVLGVLAARRLGAMVNCLYDNGRESDTLQDAKQSQSS